MGNGEVKELICMTHRHEIRWQNDGVGTGQRGIKGRKRWDNCNSIINKIYIFKNLQCIFSITIQSPCISLPCNYFFLRDQTLCEFRGKRGRNWEKEKQNFNYITGNYTEQCVVKVGQQALSFSNEGDSWGVWWGREIVTPNCSSHGNQEDVGSLGGERWVGFRRKHLNQVLRTHVRANHSG